MQYSVCKIHDYATNRVKLIFRIKFHWVITAVTRLLQVQKLQQLGYC